MQVERTRLDDQAVLDALHTGAPGALHELWTRYGDVAYWAAMALTGDMPRAADVVVDTFAMLERTPGAARRQSLPEYLVAAVRQRCAAPGSQAPLWGLTDLQLTVVALVRSQQRQVSEVAQLLDVSRSTVCEILGDALTTLSQPGVSLP